MSQNPIDNNQASNLNVQNNSKTQQEPKRNRVLQNERARTVTIIKRNSQNNKIFKRKSLTKKQSKRKSLNKLSFRKSTIMKKNDYEINRLEYSDALKYDKRNFFQYYWSLLKTGHIGIFAFVPNNDYNSRVIKVCLFFFSFALIYTVNSLFFTDSSMNNILENDGKYDFIFQVVQIVYSSLISSVVNIIMKALALTQQNILILKVIKKGETLDKKLRLLSKKLKIKFTLFFIISFSLLILFWIFVSCFCAVYRNTQIFLISDTLISFGFSLIYPFWIYLIPAIFRISALRNKKCECIYKISLFIQLI